MTGAVVVVRPRDGLAVVKLQNLWPLSRLRAFSRHTAHCPAGTVSISPQRPSALGRMWEYIVISHVKALSFNAMSVGDTIDPVVVFTENLCCQRENLK